MTDILSRLAAVGIKCEDVPSTAEYLRDESPKTWCADFALAELTGIIERWAGELAWERQKVRYGECSCAATIARVQRNRAEEAEYKLVLMGVSTFDHAVQRAEKAEAELAAERESVAALGRSFDRVRAELAAERAARCSITSCSEWQPRQQGGEGQ